MSSAFFASSATDLPLESPQYLDDDLSIGLAAEALLACHARGADRQTLLSMCERLLDVTERVMLERENRMMAAGDENLAAQVRRNADVLFVLGQQVRALRRGGVGIPATFVQFVTTLAARFSPARHEAA